MDIEKVNNKIRKFVSDRDWEKFHTPKNISMALSVEASELLEIFQWHDDDSFIENKEKLIDLSRDEIADIFYYLMRMCQLLEIDLEEAFFQKMKKNISKYPKEKFKGKSTWENK